MRLIVLRYDTSVPMSPPTIINAAVQMCLNKNSSIQGLAANPVEFLT